MNDETRPAGIVIPARGFGVKGNEMENERKRLISFIERNSEFTAEQIKEDDIDTLRYMSMMVIVTDGTIEEMKKLFVEIQMAHYERGRTTSD